MNTDTEKSKMILRNDIKRIVGELAQNGTIKFNLMDCYNLIHEYCKKHKCNPTENIYEVVNAHLLINNEVIAVVDYIPRMPPIDEEKLAYLESKFYSEMEDYDY